MKIDEFYIRMRCMNNRKVYNALEHAIEKDGKSKGTYREYFANVRYLDNYFNNKNLKKITKDELNEYIVYLDKKYSKTTYNNHVAAIRCLYKKVIKREDLQELLNLKDNKKV